MKRALLLLVFLPVVSFGYTVEELQSLVYGASPFYFLPDSTNTEYYTTQSGFNFDTVHLAFQDRQLAVIFNRGNIFSPSFNTLTNTSRLAIDYPLRVRPAVFCGVSVVPKVQSIYSFALSLWNTVYSVYPESEEAERLPPGFSNYHINGNYRYVNFDASVAVQNILTSTNNVYHQILLNYVSGLSQNVASINSSVSQLVPVVESVRDVNVNILSNSVTIVSNTLDIIDALIGDYPEEEPTRGTKGGAKGPYNDVRTSIKSQLQAWRNQATTQLQTWKTDLADQLEAWKTSDETGYLNIRKKLEDNFETKPPAGSSNTNNLPYTAFVTNQVVKVITNVVERSVAEGSAQISTNVQREAANTRKLLQDDLITPLFDPNGSGVNVNIKAPLWGQSQSAVHVHDSALDTFGVSVGASLDDMNQWLGDIYSQGGDQNDNWQAWFDRWDGFSEFTVGWFTDWWDLLADNMDSFYSAFYTADGTRRMMLELISSPDFRADVYQGLNWFQRVEYLLGFIANVSTGTVEVADIENDMDDQISALENVGTNLVSASSRVVDLFDYVTRFSTSLKNAFQSSSAPVTDGIVLLQGDSWFTADQPLVLRVDINVQNACRLGAQCIWYCGAFVVIWLVVSWAWSKILAVCRWLWSLFDI